MFIVDAHEDIAWNALTFGRDYTQSALAIRAAEAKTRTPHRNGAAMLGLPEWLLWRVGIIFGTLFTAPWRRKLGEWDTQSYRTAAEAHTLAQAQLDLYHRLEDEHPLICIIRNAADVERVVQSWANEDLRERQIGIVILMEGADPIREPAEAEYWMEQDVRIVGLAWAGTRYAGGTGEPGPLTAEGRELLGHMADLGLILDLSHMTDDGVDQALDTFEGTLIASHSNARKFAGRRAPERYLRDDQIRRLAERGGVVGVVLFNHFLAPHWTPGDGKARVTVAKHVSAVIDHVCQLTGSAAFVGIGSDFDGGFGSDKAPAEIDTVADLYTIANVLAQRGYNDGDVAAVMSDNWLRILRQGLPT